MSEYLEQKKEADYTESNIDELGELLNQFMRDLSRARGDQDSAKLCVKELGQNLNALHDQTGMIDTVERDRILKFIDLCLHESGIGPQGETSL